MNISAISLSTARGANPVLNIILGHYIHFFRVFSNIKNFVSEGGIEPNKAVLGMLYLKYKHNFLLY